MFIPEYIVSPDPTRVLVLGGTDLGKRLALAFADLGVEVTVLADATLEDIEQLQPHYVVPVTKNIPAGIGDALVPSPRAYDREEIRRIATEELGLPMSKFQFASSAQELLDAANDLGYPCVAKSANSIHLLVSADDCERAWEGERMVVERYVEFDYEIALLAVRSVDPETEKLATWFCEPIVHIRQDGILIGAAQPVALNSIALDNARSVAARITNAVGGRGVFGVKLFVIGEDIYFSELSPYPFRSGAVTCATQRFDQFTLHARAVLGLPVDVTLVTPGAIAFSNDVRPITRESVIQALNMPEIHVAITQRGAVALSTADTAVEAVDRAMLAISRMAGHQPHNHDQPFSFDGAS
ncbi:ATP-grasp domain-containing protein [Corynebacterium pseudotuberculosis]|uniref:ATP-grasp domain-containing protein n=1 Tax=Corynebacterium pseudotuberculosis TaxID=1719 RepID=UPI0002324824|nr:ATP-grasp domain-containing protein [Corynebacterium pseudotuberculosis]AER69845.1 Phosphoribosyl glycinamide formyltransferase 2 [Corynebacterium pseudotuberculosis 1/06-A]AFB73187.1 ATP-grasp domain-containing protein [Corynebacterium pseudotuberculosis 316]AMN70680.1 ATP-grasp domain-containing protein [Corynebacterium pseudotuberculosis]AMN72529.1 phosphoribosylglycinamide formyltransferase [Corynebacterium pseudotuberculosis]AMN74610.1 phosphoribosylglycinamide formyltransferase [Coryn